MINKLGYILLLSCITWTNVFAAAGNKYSLINTGVMSISKYNTTAINTLGVTGGIGITPALSMEAHLAKGFSGGEYSVADEQYKFDIMSLGIYLAFRHDFTRNYFFKAVAGTAFDDVKITRGGDELSASSGFGGSAGAGIGFFVGKTTMEINMTVLEKEITLYNIGLSFEF